MKPYMTDDEIVIIDNLLKKEWTVFEWGSGGSTLRWRPKVKEWISIDHDKAWAAKSGAIFEENEENYIKFPETIGKRIDLFIVDGILREQCLETASKFPGITLEHDSIRTEPSPFWRYYVDLAQGLRKGNHKGLRLYIK